jgi:hypothetical protein
MMGKRTKPDCFYEGSEEGKGQKRVGPALTWRVL